MKVRFQPSRRDGFCFFRVTRRWKRRAILGRAYGACTWAEAQTF